MKTTRELTGYEAIEWRKNHWKAQLNKHSDPESPAQYDIDCDYAEEVALEDPSLIWLEVEDD